MDNDPIDSLNSALDLARHGFAVFPIKPNSKVPANSHGSLEATSDPKEIERLWGNALELTKLGLADEPNLAIEAKRSNLVLVDADMKPGRDGLSSLASLDKYGKLPDTLRARTPNDGLHFYFRLPAGMKRPPNLKDHPLIGAGIEIKADNEYLVAAPSRIGDKSYEWIDQTVPIADFPEWLAALAETARIPEKAKREKPAIPTEPLPAKFTYTSNDVHERFNQSHSIGDILATYGYTNGVKADFMQHPNGDSCDSVHLLGNISYHFGAGDSLRGKGGGKDSSCFDAFGVEVALRFGGDAKAAIKTLSAEYGMDWQKPQWDIPSEGDPLSVDEAKTHQNERVTPCAAELIEADWDSVEGEIEWLWQEHIPLEGISLLAGIGGLGKSTLAIDLAAIVSTGRKFPDGSTGAQGHVIIFSAEDPAKVVKARLIRQGADLRYIHLIEGARIDGRERYFTVNDVPILEEALNKYPQTKLVIIDPVSSYMNNVNSHNTSEVRTAMKPITKLAELRKIAVLLIMHLNKDSSKGADDRISGTAGWRDLARSVFMVAADKANEHRGLVYHRKANYAAKQPPRAYTIDESRTLLWDQAPVTCSLEEALAPATTQKQCSAEEFLQEILRGRKLDSDTVKELAEQRGISRRTLWRAKDEIGIVAKRSGGLGEKGKWIWELPVEVKTIEKDLEDERPF